MFDVIHADRCSTPHSFALPHGLPSRTLLYAPFGNQIFFAGEAVNISSHTAAHGAFISGRDAATRIIRLLKKK